ncbi:MAG: lipopolysaccharide biosynthesis protein [Thermoguttaceae bacterium]|jgi:O-antigen/teichoic acid export membrane protein
MASAKYGRTVRLVIDIGVFAFGSLLARLIQFVMLPFYTTYLTTGEYGSAELVFNFSQLMSPIATLSVASGVFRYAADNVDRRKLLSTGLFVALCGQVVIISGALLWNSFCPVQYVGFFCILLLGEALKWMFGNVTRGFGSSKRFAMGGPVDVFTLSISNIILIGFMKMGVTGYLLSLVIANYTTSAYYFFASRLYRYLHPRAIDKEMLRALIVYSIPMMFNAVIWWFVNMSGRYIILFRGGEDLAGCFIAASKLPAVISMAATIFQQAWQFSTAKEVHSDTRDQFFSSVFRFFFYYVFSCATIVVALCPFIADLMLKKEFRQIGFLLPILFTSGLLYCFACFFGTFYNAFKQNAMIMVSTLVGAIVGVSLAYWFNIVWGPLGVAIGTMCGFILMVAVLVFDTQRRFVKLEYKVAPILLLIALYSTQIIVQTMGMGSISWLLCFSQLIVVFCAEYKAIISLPGKIKDRLAARRRAG